MNFPVFIVSSERSGTNLLRRLIGKFTEIDNPPPIHLLKWLYFSQPFYGDLTKDSNFEELAEDALDLAYIHFSPWQIDISKKDILKSIQSKDRSVLSLFDYLYSTHANANNKSRFVCKDNHLFDFLYPLLHYYKKPYFIYLYRDPRDYALSQYNRTLMTNDLYTISQLWKNEQLKCFQLVTDPTLREHTYQLSYEELIQNEKQVMKDLTEFLDTSFIPYKEDTTKNKKEFLTEEWKNLDQKVLSQNFGKYKTGFSGRQIKFIESICWHPMHYLGYDSENTTRPEYNLWYILLMRLRYRLSDRWRRPKKQLGKEEYKRRQKRKKLIRKFKSRL